MFHAARPPASTTTRRISPPSFPSPLSLFRPMLTLRVACSLADHVEEALPARPSERGQGIPNPLHDTGPVVFLPGRLVRPVDQQRSPLDLVARKEAPEAAVAAVVAVVSQHQELALWHCLRPPAVAQPVTCLAVLRIVGAQRRLDEVRVGLEDGLPVDEDLLVADLDRLAGQADHPLDEVASGVFRELEDD